MHIGNIFQNYIIDRTDRAMLLVICEQCFIEHTHYTYMIQLLQYWNMPLECVARVLRWQTEHTAHAQMCSVLLKIRYICKQPNVHDDVKHLKENTVDNAKELLMLVWVRFEVYMPYMTTTAVKDGKKWSKVTKKIILNYVVSRDILLTVVFH